MNRMNTEIETTIVPVHMRTRRIWMIGILGSLSALAPLSIDMYLPSLPTMTRDLHTSMSLTQLSLTFCLIGLALGQLLAGPISDARGRRIPLITGLIIYTVASFLCALTSSIWILILLRFIQGLAGSSGVVISRAIVRDQYAGTEMTKFFALLMLVNGAAPILAPIVGAQLLRFTSWHGVFIVLGGLGVAMCMAVVWMLPETLLKPSRSKGGVVKTLSTMQSLLGDRAFSSYAWPQGLVFAAMFAYISGSPFVLQNIFHVSPQGFSLIFAINGIGIIVASYVSARLSMRMGEQHVLQMGLGWAAGGSLLLFAMIHFGAGLIFVLLPLFLVVSSVGAVSTTSSSLAMQEQGQNAGSAAALIGVSQLLAGAMVSPLVGLGGTQTATPMGLVIAGCDVGAIVFYLLLKKRNKRTGGD